MPARRIHGAHSGAVGGTLIEKRHQARRAEIVADQEGSEVSAMPYPARVASRKASAFVALKRPLTATVRMCPSMLKRQSTGRPP